MNTGSTVPFAILRFKRIDIMLKYSVRILIGIVLSLSLVANYFLFQKGFEYYKDLNRLRLDPLELNVRARTQKTNRSQDRRTRILFYGDSRIAHWRPLPDLSGCIVINKGISGQTTTQLKLRLEEDVLSYSPDVVVLQAGINDLKTIGLFPEYGNNITANCEQNLYDIIQIITDRHITVVMTTIFPTGKPGLIRSCIWSEKIGAAIEKINGSLSKISDQQVVLIDSYRILRKGKFIDPAFKKDMLHLNSKGYGLLNKTLRPKLLEITTH